MSKFKNFIYLPSLIPGLITIFGNLTGGWFAASTIVLILLLSIPDQFLKNFKTGSNPDEKTIPTLILILHPILQTVSVASLLYGIYSGILTGPFMWLAVISTGMYSGSGATLSAHELIHRRNWLKWLGVWNLFTVNYSSYFIEHIQGHHKNVATILDPSTAKINQNFYSFFLKAIPWQYKDALEIEANRLRRRGKAPYSLKNFVIWTTALKLVFLAALFTLSPLLFLAFMLQAFVARTIHESISYAQHYGLHREIGERINPVHAWQSNSILGEMFLLELTRHSDHHFHVTRTYPELESHIESPELPVGYYAIFSLTLIPPLWYKIMNPRVEKLSLT
jgi:alkane 1-monooxygenase